MWAAVGRANQRERGTYGGGGPSVTISKGVTKLDEKVPVTVKYFSFSSPSASYFQERYWYLLWCGEGRGDDCRPRSNG